jgi:hypothetical protein
MMNLVPLMVSEGKVSLPRKYAVVIFSNNRFLSDFSSFTVNSTVTLVGFMSFVLMCVLLIDLFVML